MSRESLFDLVENMKGSLTSEHYKLLVEEIAKVKPEVDEELEMTIISPMCHPSEGFQSIRNHLGLLTTKLVLTKSKMTDEQWNTWLNHDSETVSTGYVLSQLPDCYHDQVWFLLPCGGFQFRTTLSYEEEPNELLSCPTCCEEEECDSEEKSKRRTVQLIPDIDQVHVSIKRITKSSNSDYQ